MVLAVGKQSRVLKSESTCERCKRLRKRAQLLGTTVGVTAGEAVGRKTVDIFLVVGEASRVLRSRCTCGGEVPAPTHNCEPTVTPLSTLTQSRRPVSDGDGETVTSPRMLSSLSLLQFFWRLLLLSAGCAAYCRVTYWLLPSSLFAARLRRTAGYRSTIRRPSPQKAPSLCNSVWLCTPQIRFFAICLLVDKLLILFV
ncbi:Hypothetical predicted protein [Olea europaea subsp. europaea]|uniref:Uncharacterized protein n=1 Tax=Olea europaea subsp. europaea TaxID=158383 RepID=A0A8S0VAR2_OLEEU|nr:Hypothetical predicted protein [Olea europaea subsp. europaea]